MAKIYSAQIVVTEFLQEVLFESKIHNAAHSIIYICLRVDILITSGTLNAKRLEDQIILNNSRN